MVKGNQYQEPQDMLLIQKTLLFGAEYIPEKYSNYSFLKRMEYRIGCAYTAIII